MKKNMTINYIINKNTFRVSQFKEIALLLKDYRIQEVIKGPDWCPSIYFYMVRK